MLEVNLLSWRVEQKKQYKNRLLILYGFILSVAVVIVSGLHEFFSHKVAHYVFINHETEIKISQAKTINNSLIAHALSLDELGHQQVLQEIFNRFMQMQEKIKFTEFSVQAKKISIKGSAMTLGEVRLLMNKLVTVRHTDFVRLISLKQLEAGLQFDLLVMER